MTQARIGTTTDGRSCLRPCGWFTEPRPRGPFQGSVCEATIKCFSSFFPPPLHTTYCPACTETQRHTDTWHIIFHLKKITVIHILSWSRLLVWATPTGHHARCSLEGPWRHFTCTVCEARQRDAPPPSTQRITCTPWGAGCSKYRRTNLTSPESFQSV